MKRRQNLRMVKTVTADVMDGDTPLEKELNAYLTKQFILRHDVPSDECLDDARDILAMVAAAGIAVDHRQCHDVICNGDRRHPRYDKSAVVCNCLPGDYGPDNNKTKK